MADSFVTFLARFSRPFLLPLARRLAGPKRIATWHYEAGFVAVVLIAVSVLTSPTLGAMLAGGTALREFLIIWISAGAVFGSFLHAQIGTYMAEDMSHSEFPITPCFHKLGEYWVYKEILWLTVFFISGAYPAIAGAIIFLFFPVWRRIYKAERKRIAGGKRELDSAKGV